MCVDNAFRYCLLDSLMYGIHPFRKMAQKPEKSKKVKRHHTPFPGNFTAMMYHAHITTYLK
jgi:hypothetical protein